MTLRRLIPSDPHTLGLAAFLVFFGAFFRIARLDLLPDLPNFAPLTAIAFCGALVLPGILAAAVPLAALIASDLLLNLHYGAPLFGAGEFIRYACYLAAVGTGLLLRRRRTDWTEKLTAVAANSLLFYVVTNSASWLASPSYAKSFAGWLQALTIGQPGFPPSYVFFRNSLVSDLLFTFAFLAAIRLAASLPREDPAGPEHSSVLQAGTVNRRRQA